jgi:competence ComEA-like helix-hairpin-helix protein
VKALAMVMLAALLWSGATRALEPVAVDLNQATVEQLERLPGIGPKKAEAIVELRKKKPFTRITQLMEVRGIGRKTLDRLRPYVRVAEPPAPSALSTPAPPAASPAGAAVTATGPASPSR